MCIVVGALYFAREVLVPLALAMLLSFLLSPVVRWLERVKIPRAPATLAVVLVAVGLVGGVGYMVGRQFTSIVYQLPNYQDQLQAKIRKFGSRGSIFKKAAEDVKTITAAAKPADGASKDGPAPGTPGALPQRVPPLFPQPAPAADPAHPAPGTPTPENPLPVREYPQTSAITYFRDFAGTVLDPLFTAGLVIIFVIFMMLGREDLRDRFIRLVGGQGRLNLTTQAMDEASTRISGYLGALAIVNGSYAVLTALGLWAVGHFFGKGHGFPNVLVWGILVGVFRFVPYIGIWIGAAAPLVLSFALFPGNGVFFGTIGVFLVLELIVSQFVEPFWYGSSTGMSALAVLVAAVFWTWLWGPVGLLLSTPLTVVMVVVGKYVPQMKFLDILLREEPVLSPHLRFYQRLIAGDQEEATDLAQEYLKEKKSLEAAYDDLMIPTLAMAEQDAHKERLEEALHATIRQSVREIVEELADQFRTAQATQATLATEPASKSVLAAAASTVSAAASSVAAAMTGNTPNPVAAGAATVEKGNNPRDNTITRRPNVPKGCAVNVLCLPARGDSDQIAVEMLGELLEIRGYCVVIATTDALAAEMVGMVESKNADVVCVSAMPPAAVSHARYLCKRLHARYPNIPMAIGLWTTRAEHVKRAKERMICSNDVQVLTTLHAAQDEIDRLAQPAILKASQQSGTTASVIIPNAAAAPASVVPA